MPMFFFLYVKALKSREHGCILAGSTSGATERSWQSSEPVEPDGVLLDGFADAASRSDRGCAAAAGHGARQRSQAIRHHPLGWSKTGYSASMLIWPKHCKASM